MAAHVLLDDPQEWAAFGRMRRSSGQNTREWAAFAPTAPEAPEDVVSDPVWESHVVLEGMHCAACALTIEDALRAFRVWSRPM
jgi:Cu2+-exporting ATPase